MLPPTPAAKHGKVCLGLWMFLGFRVFGVLGFRDQGLRVLGFSDLVNLGFKVDEGLGF